jgi:hypothetical protein
MAATDTLLRKYGFNLNSNGTKKIHKVVKVITPVFVDTKKKVENKTWTVPPPPVITPKKEEPDTMILQDQEELEKQTKGPLKKRKKEEKETSNKRKKGENGEVIPVIQEKKQDLLQESISPSHLVSVPTRKTKVRKIIYRIPESNESVLLCKNIEVGVLQALMQQVQNKKLEADKDIEMTLLENQQVRIGPPSKTIAGFRRDYLLEYRTRKEVIEKRKAKALDPVEIAKKQAYAARPDVKANKRRLAREGRLFKKTARLQYPALHKELIDLIRKDTEKNSDSSSTSENSSDESSSNSRE